MGTHWNCLTEAIPMSTHKICFCAETTKIILWILRLSEVIGSSSLLFMSTVAASWMNELLWFLRYLNIAPNEVIFVGVTWDNLWMLFFRWNISSRCFYNEYKVNHRTHLRGVFDNNSGVVSSVHHKKYMLWVFIRSASWGASNEYPHYMILWRTAENYPRNFYQIFIFDKSSVTTSYVLMLK